MLKDEHLNREKARGIPENPKTIYLRRRVARRPEIAHDARSSLICYFLSSCARSEYEKTSFEMKRIFCSKAMMQNGPGKDKTLRTTSRIRPHTGEIVKINGT